MTMQMWMLQRTNLLNRQHVVLNRLEQSFLATIKVSAMQRSMLRTSKPLSNSIIDSISPHVAADTISHYANLQGNQLPSLG